MHFAVSRDGKTYEPWNSGYGILFAEGTITEQNTIRPKGVKDPHLSRRRDGSFAITARRVEEDGSEDEESRGKVLLWLTEISSVSRHADWWRKTGFLEEREGTDTLPVDAAVCGRAALYWGKLRNIGIHLPERVKVSDAEELERVKALAVYTGRFHGREAGGLGQRLRGLQQERRVSDQRPGKKPRLSFPAGPRLGRSVIFPWEGKYYYIATNDNRNDIGFYVREAERPEELFGEHVKQHVILDYDEKRELIQTFWAPEFHVIGGRLYILFAVGPREWGPQCWLMRLKEGGRITDPAAWEDPVRIRKKTEAFCAGKGLRWT